MSEAGTNLGSGASAAVEDLESWAGEVRLNLVRLAALIAFYAYHLINVYLSRDDPALAGTYHVAVTALVMVWSVGVVALYLGLSRRRVPPALKYGVTLWDLVLVTALLILAGGPRTPLVILLFLVIAAAPLRLSLPLVYLATLGAIAAYLFVLGYYAYYQVGYDRYYADPQLQIPRTQEVIFILGLGAAGILAGQGVRQAGRLLRATAGAGVPRPLAEASGAAAADVRWDARWIAGGMVGVAVLVGLGIVFSFTAAPAAAGRNRLTWASLVISIVFVVAVAAALVELLRPEKGAARSVPGAG